MQLYEVALFLIQVVGFAHTHTHSLSRPEILEELIGLIAREANEDAEDKVKYK